MPAEVFDKFEGQWEGEKFTPKWGSKHQSRHSVCPQSRTGSRPSSTSCKYLNWNGPKLREKFVHFVHFDNCLSQIWRTTEPCNNVIFPGVAHSCQQCHELMCHFSWPHIRTYIHALSRRVSIAYIVTSAFSLILNLNSGHYAVLAVAVVRSYFRLKCIDNRIIKLKYRFSD